MASHFQSTTLNDGLTKIPTRPLDEHLPRGLVQFVCYLWLLFEPELGSLYANEKLNFNKEVIGFLREPFQQLYHALGSFLKNQVESKPAK
jgi:hypothetical protein